MPATPLKLSERQAAALSGETTLKVLSASSDLTLLVDENDTIREVSASHDDPRLQTAESWIGRRWTDVVTPESRPKVERMLAEARERGSSARARQVNHPSPDGVHIPLLYSAVELGGDADVIAVARDMGPLAQMQQRLVTAQQALERDYARLMEMERRYRTLFATTSNGVVMVEATSGDILEANPAAVELLAPGALRISGRRFPEGFDRASAQALASAMETARSGGAVQDLPARLLAGERPCRVSMHLFQEAGAAILLVRITPVDEGEGAVVGERARLLADCLQGAPDGFVAVGGDGRILHANAAFVSMVEAVGEEAVRRQPLDTYLGRSSVDVEVLLSALKEGSLRSYATLLRGEHGRVSEVEIGAVRLADRPATGVFVHDMARRLPPVDAVAARPIPDFTTALVGRQPLKAIVAQTADAIEQLCIEKALALTGDNRAAAAELLGLSRQTLYAKLRRLGFEVGGED